ncbi:MAG: ABC transporter permease [Actinomycetota bacterium]|nr:ABC transporter permease [Actinomycetota bacterium]
MATPTSERATPPAEDGASPGQAGPGLPASPAGALDTEAAATLPARPRVLRPRRGRRALGLVLPALLLGAWCLVSARGVISTKLLPAPWDVLEAARDFVVGGRADPLAGVVPFEGAALEHLTASLRRWLSAYALAVAVGLTVGLGIGLSRVVADLLDPLVQALRAIPIFAWLPLALVWFGLGEGAARYLVFVGAVSPIIVATADSVSRVPRAYVETALMLGARHRSLAGRVYLPAALPGIVTGLRLGMTLGWMSVIVGELTGSQTGIGAMMNAARETGRLDQIVVGMLCFAVVGLVADLLLRAATRRYVAWNDR